MYIIKSQFSHGPQRGHGGDSGLLFGGGGLRHYALFGARQGPEKGPRESLAWRACGFHRSFPAPLSRRVCATGRKLPTHPGAISVHSGGNSGWPSLASMASISFFRAKNTTPYSSALQ